MKEKIDFKIIAGELAERIIKFFPYFLFFYLASLILEIFFNSWRSLIYWPALHILAIVYLVFYFFKSLKGKNKNIFFILARALIEIFQLIKSLIFWFREAIMGLRKKDWLKIFILALILIFSAWRGIAFFDFFILAFGLLSFLYIFDSRISAGIALAFLVFCPILIIFKKNGWAESAAIYAYYFLIITVLTQIREINSKDKTKKLADKAAVDNLP
jgi:hypothetical protein